MKTAKHSFKRYLAYLLVCALVMSNISVTAYAEGTTSVPDDEVNITQEETLSDSENDTSSASEILDEDNEDPFTEQSIEDELIEDNPMETVSDDQESDISDAASENEDGSTDEDSIFMEEENADESVAEEEAEAEPVAFDQSQTVNNMVVMVKAEPGVFPEGAALSVELVPVKQQEQVDAAVEELRGEDQNVALSYTFDIKVIDPETGIEYQPAEGQKVSVSFALAEVADENLATSVYHVTENESTGEFSVEALDVTLEDEVTAVVNTDGFSLYTVEFTYNTLEYVLQGDSSIALSDILQAVGLSGEVTAVEVSDETLFSVSNETGEWMLTARQAFDTTEWMTVTIGGVTYQIIVTDDSEAGTLSVDYVENGSTKTADDVTALTTDSTNWTSGWYAVTSDVTISNRVQISGTVYLILCDGATLNAKKGIHLSSGNSLTIYSQSEGTGKLNANIDDADSRSYGDAAVIGGNYKEHCGTLTINGGQVKAVRNDDKALGAAIGGGQWGHCGTIIINGGTVEASVKTAWCAAIGGGDGGMGGYGGSITINGGTVTVKGDTMEYSSIGATIGDYGDEITLGGVSPTTINASKYRSAVKVADGICLAENDGTKYYTGTISNPSEISGKTLFSFYLVDIAAAEHGSVKADRIMVPVNNVSGDITLTVTPEEGYDLTSLMVNGEDVADQVRENTYTFPMPGSSVDVSAVFKQPRTVTVDSVITHGSVAVVPVGTVHEGDVITLRANPDTGYALDSLTVTDANGSSVVVENNTFIMPDSSVTVSAVFKQTHSVTVDSTITHGSVTVAPVGTVYAGDEITLTVTPDAGYVLDSLTVTDANDGNVALENNTFTMPDADVTVTAAFRYITAETAYIDENGASATADAHSLLVTDIDLAEGWYVAQGSISIDTLTLTGNVKLILADGAALTVDSLSGGNLTIYGQSGQSGALSAANGITADAVSVYGGNVSVNSDSMIGIAVNDFTISSGAVNADVFVVASAAINGGTVTGDVLDGKRNDPKSEITVSNGTVNGSITYAKTVTVSGGVVANENNYAIYSPNGSVTVSAGAVTGDIVGNTITISRGTVTANGSDGIKATGTLTLGCGKKTDSITASSFTGSTVKVQSGQYLGDGKTVYNGTLDNYEINALSGNTLRKAYKISYQSPSKYEHDKDYAVIGEDVTITPKPGTVFLHVQVGGQNIISAPTDQPVVFQVPEETGGTVYVIVEISDDVIPYVDANGSNMTPIVDYIEIDGSKSFLSDYRDDTTKTFTWFVVKDNVSCSGLVVNTDANLILCDGASLTISSGSIQVYAENELTIWGQKAGTGALNVTGASGKPALRDDYREGPVNINGGTLNLTGGSNASGIGGYGSWIRINGGTVTANGGSGAAGIGSESWLYFNGGKINASGASHDILVAENCGIEIAGNPTITGDVYLPAGKTIAIAGTLTNSTPIAVSMETPGVFTSGLNGKGNAENFTSADENYTVRLTERGEAELVPCITVTYDVNGGQGEAPVDSAKYASGDSFKALSGEGLTKDGYTFYNWNTQADGTGTSYEPGEEYQITENLTFYAQWAHEHDGIEFQPWTSSNSLPGTAGNYFLMNDVTLAYSGTGHAWTVPTGTVNLCLHGHTIANEEGNNNAVIYVGQGATLNLYDDAEDGGKITGGYMGVFAEGGTFCMHGGTITGCSDGVDCNNGGSFTMTGGTITGNSLCGVEMADPDNGSFSVSGSPIINNNGGANEYYTGKANVCLNKGSNGHYIKITVQGPLTEDALIGVTLGKGGGGDTITSGLSGNGDASNFLSDDQSRIVWLNDSGEARLATYWTVTFDADGGTEIEPQKVAKSQKATKPEAPTKEGLVFQGWYQVTATDPETLADTTFDFDTAITGDITLKAVWEEATTVIIKSANVEFQGLIRLKFTFTFPADVLTDEGAYLTFEKAGTTTTRLVSEGSASGEDVRFMISVPAPEYADDITIKVYDSEGRQLTLKSSKGTDYTENGFVYSVKAYAQKMSVDGSTEQMRRLAKALDDYGAAAQIYFTYGDYSSLSVDSAVTAVTLEDLAPYALTTSGTRPAGVTGAGIMVEFESDNTLRITFKTDGSKPLSDYTFLLDDVEATPTKSGKNAYLQVVNIAAPNLDTAHSFTVSDGTDIYTITASALSYAYTSVKNGNAARQNLGKALYLYNQAAIKAFDE